MPFDYRSLGYNRFNTFVYRLERFDAANNHIGTDTLGLFCSDVLVPDGDSQTVMQWQALSTRGGSYVLADGTANNISTGVKVTRELLYIHPPREGSLRELQFVPHPLFRDLDRTGNSWTWDLVVGSYWSTPPRYVISYTDTIHFSYRVARTDAVCTECMPELCAEVRAEAVSRFGRTSATYFISRKHGLVYFLLRTPEHRFRFSLIQKLEGPERQAVNPAFQRMHETKRERRGWY